MLKVGDSVVCIYRGINSFSNKWYYGTIHSINSPIAIVYLDEKHISFALTLEYVRRTIILCA